MTARTVTGKTVLPTGSAQASQTVTFVKRSTTISGITVTQATPPITATTDASGNFSASLDCPADGSTQWTIIYPDGGEFDFTLPYGDGSSVAVTTLISAATVDADAVTLLLDGYEPDLGNPGTSGHVLSSTTAGVRSWVAQPDLTTHAALTVTAHGGLLPQDAAILSKSGAYPLAAGDEGKIIECNGTFTITLPDGLDTGFQVAIVNIGTGVITLAAATTLTTKDSAVTLASQYGAATVYHAGSNVWRAIGDLS